MKALRIGTRGSELALWQANWVRDRLRATDRSLAIELVVIKTHGDLAAREPFGPAWPAGAFVGAVEVALLDGRVDLAVHSYKDLPTAETVGLTIAAIPERGPVHDALLTRGVARLEDLPAGARIGTNSARRAAQLGQIGDFEFVPIRGNVPTRIEKLEREGLDGVVLAAAGLERLGIAHPHRIDLPTDRFVPAPAQGALAVQTRAGAPTADIVAAIDDPATRRAVTAERAVLLEIEAGCHTPVGALATVAGDLVRLRAQLFSDDHARAVVGTDEGRDAAELGARLARRLMEELTG